MRSSAACHCSSAILLRGRIFEACAIAPVRPASRSSCRKTLLSTCRGKGLRPKLTLLRPTTVWHSGSSLAIRRVPSIVARAFLRSSSMPVLIGRTSGSNIRSQSRKPCFVTAKSRMRFAIEILRSSVRAIAFSGSSSMHPITTAAPYFFARRQMSANFSSPSSRFVLLSAHRPPASLSATSITPGGRSSRSSVARESAARNAEPPRTYPAFRRGRRSRRRRPGPSPRP